MKKTDRDAMRARMVNSANLFSQAQKVLLSHYATSSWGRPVEPVFVKECKGSRIIDVDGNEYIDMCMGYGPVILGHCHPLVSQAARDAVDTGAVHGMGHEYEVRYAELIVEAVPFADFVTFTNSGTEATMHALRIARAYTGKEKVAKFEGCFHGTHDYAQISGRGARGGPVEEPFSIPLGSGIPRATLNQVITLSLNQPETFDIIYKNRDELAAVIVEPIPTCCPIDIREFLGKLREVTRECNVILIFDEVLSGFRYNYGSIASVYQVCPDLSTFGKAIGGGFPVGAVVGSKKIMKPMISTGNIKRDIVENVYIVGTFSGNPVTCAAGAANLRYLKENPGIYDRMAQMADDLKIKAEVYARDLQLPFQCIGRGSWFLPYFAAGTVEKPRDMDWANNGMVYELFKRYMLKNHVLLADVPLLFLSAAHTEEDCRLVADAIQKSFQEMY